LSGIARAQKSILMMVIYRYFTVLVLDRQYQVSDWIILESISLKISQRQTYDAYLTVYSDICGQDRAICVGQKLPRKNTLAYFRRSKDVKGL
jgi:hypothetical protein